MNIPILEPDVLRWAIVLTIGFPLAMLVLGELIFRSRRGKHALSTTLVNLRNLLLPALALWALQRYVMDLPGTSTSVRIARTAIWLALLYTALGFVNEVVFRMASAEGWQARVPKLLIDLVRLVLIAVGASMILSTVWGADLTSLVTALGIGSIVIGLALQEPLGNVFAGIMLLFERPVALGDWIEVEGAMGKVVEINWRAVHVETSTNELQIVPNSLLNKGSFRNLSRPTPLRTELIELGFSYDDPPNTVKRVLLEVAHDTPGVLENPPPKVRTINYADCSITYRVIISIADQSGVYATKDEFLTRVWYAAKRTGLTIPFPIQTEIQLSQRELDKRAEPPIGEMLDAFPEWTACRGGAGEAGDVSAELAARAQVRQYAGGETVARIGGPLDGLHLVVSGSVMLSVTDSEGKTRQVGRVGPGEFFGEGSILAGQDSAFAVVALEDLTVLVLAREDVTLCLDRRPALGREVGTVLDRRRRAAQVARKFGQPTARRSAGKNGADEAGTTG